MADWDPETSAFPDLRGGALRRVMGDLHNMQKSSVPGVMVFHEESNVQTVTAVALGPTETPYSFAPFFFKIKFPADYPSTSPKVRLLTTHGGTVRMGPNLYSEGKVCLSILGTWQGPGWLPTMNLENLLVNLQALLHPDPLTLEPGMESTHAPVRASYRVAVEHEVFRVAVLSQVDYRGTAAAAATPAAGAAALQCPPYIADLSPEAREFLWDNFEAMAETWAARARELARVHDGQPLGNSSPISVQERTAAPGVFEFGNIAKRIERVAAAIAAARSGVGGGTFGGDGGAAGGAAGDASGSTIVGGAAGCVFGGAAGGVAALPPAPAPASAPTPAEWSCPACTFSNHHLLTACEMCEAARL
jgi:ubiquitin-protein ligase